MNKVKLGSCVSVTRGTTLSGSFYSEKGEKIRLTLGNFDYPGGGFKENSSKKDIFFIGKVKENFILKKGDIITPLTEQVVGLLGETAKIPENDKYIQSGDIGLLKPDLTKIDPNFLYYLLPTKYVKTQLGSAAQQTKIRHTSPLKIMDCYVYLPELALQKKIGSFFSKIDKKIQINKKQIETLKSLAKTIYDYWFVQFDFPNEEGRPYKSSGGKMVWNEELKREIPEYWTVKNLSEVSDIVMGCSPKGDTINTAGDGLLFFQGASDFGNVYPIETAYTTAPIRIAKKGDLMISVRAPVGDINFTLTRCCIGRGLAAISTDKLSKSYLWCFLNNQKAHFSILNRIGTTFGCLSKNDLYKIKIVLPTKNVYNNFISITEPLEKSIRLAHLENTNLTKLKSFLLPLLMNGQVTFKEAKEI